MAFQLYVFKQNTKETRPDDILYRTQNLRVKEAFSEGEQEAGDPTPACPASSCHNTYPPPPHFLCEHCRLLRNSLKNQHLKKRIFQN